MASTLTITLVLLLGSTLLSLIYEGIVGSESFSPQILSITLTTVIGAALSFWWGWAAVFSVLGAYAAYNVAAALLSLLPAPRVDPDDQQRQARARAARVRPAPPPDPDEVTDIWFRSKLPLPEIAVAMGLPRPSLDGENYWEWVICRLGLTEIDITRPHSRPAGEVDTRLFLVHGGVMGGRLQRKLIGRLRPVVTGTIWCGRWVYTGGQEFDREVVTEYPED